MQRAIVGYHLDERDDWVAELACGHGQHVRHRPPLQFRPWVLDPAGRAERLGTMLDCVRCDRGEPAALVPLGAPREGGDAACMAHLLCEDCGAVLDGGPHRPGCAAGR